MYLAIVVLLMGVLPIASVVLEMALAPGADLFLLIGKWFVFWAIGIRLLIAGVSQVSKPQTTANILGMKDEASFVIVRELGFANLSIGSIAAAALLIPGWTNAAALAGGIFLGLAGVNHLLKGERNAKENIAMISDFAIAGVMALFLIAVAMR
ncbi:DUF6790 family protein [Hyphomicrobium sp. LHD-15]|uniref:DUF6790 family protein n=1 Tax=Hyphomicrobium sp. LHD-15 TaxID=3072142 RepID=UPI00280D5112|nr:DUF6790 family protein [Hyphomicrobium sp. LHD-15]MDQ8700319.1 hypothetical protein [Hyphomicrobium sp. LHD-15]